jgi:hypothetical protein
MPGLDSQQKGWSELATSLVIGVTSHRDLVDADRPALRETLRGWLQALHAEFPSLPLTVLSPLAEGGDRLFAEVALELGARLIVPLPLPLSLYRDDFSDAGSRAEFDRLLAQGSVVLLPQPDAATTDLARPGPLRDQQYLMSGLYIANHCHLLVALWDGRDSDLSGGTAQIVRYYLGGVLPGARRATDNLRQMLAGDDDSLVLHVPVRRTSQLAMAPLPDDSPGWLTSSARTLLDAGMPVEFRRIFSRMQTFEQDRQRYAASSASIGDGTALAILFECVDRMAGHYQRQMLRAMRAIHVLAFAMGVSFLLYSDLNAPDTMLWVFLALFLIGVGFSTLAKQREWHRKYVDYRALAEGLRVQWYWRRARLALTGDPEFAHDNFLQKQDVELEWIRNIMREAALEPLRDIADADVQLERVIEEWIGRPGGTGQLGYYERTAANRARLHLHKEHFGNACLWAGVAISVLLALFHRGLGPSLSNVLVTSMGALSLAAAVREAYAYRKADKELVKQYRFMHRIYRHARAALDTALDTREQREILRALGEAALAEHAEWALMHRNRPIEHGKP